MWPLRRAGDMGIRGGMVYILSPSWSNHSTAHSLSSWVHAGLGDICKTHQYFLYLIKKEFGFHLFLYLYSKINFKYEVYLNMSTKELII